MAWKINHSGFCGGYDWIEAKTEKQARKIWEKDNEGLEILSIEKKVNILDLFFEAENKIHEAIKDSKHLEIDDTNGDDENWFSIPVFYEKGLENKMVREFRFSRDTYETEAEMVERFHTDLNGFLNDNWKKLDK